MNLEATLVFISDMSLEKFTPIWSQVNENENKNWKKKMKKKYIQN